MAVCPQTTIQHEDPIVIFRLNNVEPCARNRDVSSASRDNKIMKTRLLISGGLLITFVGSAMITQLVFYFFLQ